MYFHLGLKKLPFEQDSKQIIYAESEYDEEINSYIQKNHQKIRDYFREKGFDFIYLPKLSVELRSKEYVKYYAPYAKNRLLDIFLKSDFIYDFMLHPENKSKIPPSLLYYNYNCIDPDYKDAICQFRGITIPDSGYEKTDDFSVLFWAIMDDISRKDSTVRFSIANDPEITADDKFNRETQKLMDEVKERIEKLKSMGIRKFYLEQLIQDEVKMSRLRITKDYRIFLPDFDNMEIKMRPLPKTVFLLFLKHPEGILFKLLPDYFDELLKIYKDIKGGFYSDADEDRIRLLTDCRNNSINEKCTRIKEAFLVYFDERLAKYYYINGERAKPKKIALPRNLVEWEGTIPQ